MVSLCIYFLGMKNLAVHLIKSPHHTPPVIAHLAGGRPVSDVCCLTLAEWCVWTMCVGQYLLIPCVLIQSQTALSI